MRCYLVTAPGAVRYGSTKADAKIKRDELITLVNCKKKDVVIEEVDVLTSKPELMGFINELCQRGDQV